VRHIGSSPRFAGRAVGVLLLCALIALCLWRVATVTLHDDAGADRAWLWVRSMLQSPTRVESSTTLIPEREYPADWTGPVRGTFMVEGIPTPRVIPAAIALDAESAAQAASPDFRGVVTGRVTLAPQPGRWIIQVYRSRNDQRSQLPVQSVAGPDGKFSIDLSGTDPGPGVWEFGVLDAVTGNSPSGDPWSPAGTYSGWEIRSFATTDARHLVGVQPASADGSFRFDSSAPGTKTFQLVAIEPGEKYPAGRILAEHAPATGLVRSLSAAVGNEDAQFRSYSYDQALALQSALVMDDLATARILVHGLIALQTRSGQQAGGFVSSAPQSNPAGGEPTYRTGNTAIALYSLMSYLHRTRESEPDAPAIRQAANQAADWLLRQQLSTGPMAGLLTGGWDQAGVEPGTRLPFASTEHNLDAWHALSRAGQVLNCPRCSAAANTLHDSILAILWDSSAGGFLQGMRPEGADRVEPLDVNSWGSIFLDAIGRTELASTSLDRTAAFAVSDQSLSGYLAFRAQPTMPNPVPSVWLEGSFGVALAQARHGGAGYADTMAGLVAAQRPDGSMPMASSVDVDRELSTASSVAATTWFILASRPHHADSLWSAS
jgi:hypothetical protein